jgi:hypothetical protein
MFLGFPYPVPLVTTHKYVSGSEFFHHQAK